MKYSSFITSAVFGLSATSVAAYRNWDVKVGFNGYLKFDPETIEPRKGDTVTYHYFAKNHSVEQSSFDKPCFPLEKDGRETGFFSAFTPTESNTTESPTTFRITINDTSPIWVYCGQTKGDHCQMGMVSALNAPKKGNTFDEFVKKAKKADKPSKSLNNDPPGGRPVGGLRQVFVKVGPDSKLEYQPNNITNTPPGSVVRFEYFPKNHSVVQSDFPHVCEPQKGGGFSSGFIPTKEDPTSSDVSFFDIVVNDTKPIWFYCAQNNPKSHCEAGMVGSINAPVSGNTLEKFIDASKAFRKPSGIPPHAPIGGIFTHNGKTFNNFGGDVFNPDAANMGGYGSGHNYGSGSGNNYGSNYGGKSGTPSKSGTSSDYNGGDGYKGNAPPPGSDMDPYMISMAGGAPPKNYHWSSSISDNATDFLQLLEFLDNILLEVLMGGYKNLTSGPWKGQYPKSVTDSLQSMSAQAMMHRATSTDSLSHYKKEILKPCKYSFPIEKVGDFVQVALTLLLLEIGVLLDIATETGPTDSWLIPALGANLGTKSRMSALLMMLEDHTAAVAPREVQLPAPMAYSYMMQHYVVPKSCPNTVKWEQVFAELKITEKIKDGSKRIISITIDLEVEIERKSDLYVAWIGPWGGLTYSPISKKDGKWKADVPKSLYGHVWCAVVTGQNHGIQDIGKYAQTSLEMVFVTDTNTFGGK